jgi:hypothetical protein
MIRLVKFLEAPHVVAQLYGVPHAILQVFIIILYGNVFQNPELFPTQVSLSPEKSTLKMIARQKDTGFGWKNKRTLNFAPHIL